MQQDPNPYQSVEVYMGDNGTAPLLLTCEHASNQLPPGYVWSEQDAWLQDTHWASDPGAADLTRQLADDVGAIAILANFSRLFIDPNRPLDEPCLFRDRADGKEIAFNSALTSDERKKRIQLCYQPYHEIAYRQARNRRGQFLLSIHSFTPIYEGNTRDQEVGIMHVDNLELARSWRDFFRERGLKAEIDQPYAGADGFMFSAHKHAVSSGRDAIMLEFRQDLLPARTAEFVDLIHDALVHTGVLIF